MSVRPALPADHPRILELQARCFPDHAQTPEQFQRDLDTLEDPFRRHWWVAEQDGQVVGVLELYHSPASYHPGRFFFDLYVHPDFRGRGHGGRLYAALLEQLHPTQPLELHGSVLEGEAVGLGMLERRGFAEVKRDFESELPLLGFDLSAFEPPEAVLERCGLTLHRFAELDSDTFRRDFHAFFSSVRLDIPRSSPPTPIAFEFLNQQVFEDPEFLREATMLARAGEQIVGISGLYHSAVPGTLEVWQTSVARPYRGRGVALALKLAGVRWALQHGYTHIRTDNDSSNAAMLRVNARLGYVRRPGWIRLLRTLGGPAPSR